VTSGLGTSAFRLATARARYGAVSNSSLARSASGAVPCIGQRNSLPAATIWGSESWARIMFPPRPGSPLGNPTFPRWTAHHPPPLASLVQESVRDCELVHTWKSHVPDIPRIPRPASANKRGMADTTAARLLLDLSPLPPPDRPSASRIETRVRIGLPRENSRIHARRCDQRQSANCGAR
jgi:hypothetical protein